MPKIALTSLVDHTVAIARKARENTDCINFVDAHVKPIAPFKVPASKQGETVFCVNGLEGKAELVEGGKVIAVAGLFVRGEEWKNTPWTKPEIEAWSAHRVAESYRVAGETKAALAGWRKRRALVKEFAGH